MLFRKWPIIDIMIATFSNLPTIVPNISSFVELPSKISVIWLLHALKQKMNQKSS